MEEDMKVLEEQGKMWEKKEEAEGMGNESD